MDYKTYKMSKKAWDPSGIFKGIGGALNQVADLAAQGSVYVLGQGLLTAAGVGYVAQKMTAHDKADIDTLRKEYANARADQDIGYLTAKIRQEADARKRKQEPKAARVF